MLNVVEALLPEAPERSYASAWTNEDAWHMGILWHLETWSSKQRKNSETGYYIT